MTLHLLGFPHTRLYQQVPTCAYTAKVARMRRMDLGEPLTVYGSHGADVELYSEEERLATFGPDDANRLPAWPTDEQWLEFNLRAIAEVATRAQPGDVVMLAGGISQALAKPTLEKRGLTVCEPGVGYEGIIADHCAFESTAWMHYVYGVHRIGDGRPTDTVIPNYFDPADFPHLNAGDGDYLLFLGRVTLRKGPQIAAEIAAAAGCRLVIAGPGVAAIAPGQIVGDQVLIEGDHVEYVGPVDAADRAELLAGARALVSPTVYVEPFGGVAVEALLTGTPVIASDWGGFTETVEHGRNGYRIHTAADGAAAVANLDQLELTRPEISAAAEARYSLDAVAPMFRAWLARIRR